MTSRTHSSWLRRILLDLDISCSPFRKASGRIDARQIRKARFSEEKVLDRCEGDGI